jgi:RpiB/LacA/LacB family sugar-phosphate isomerase
MARAHNDANVLCLGERVTGQGVAKAILEVFLATPFEGGRHANRVHKLALMERSSDETTDPGESLVAPAT